jgi:hypothetical protein
VWEFDIDAHFQSARAPTRERWWVNIKRLTLSPEVFGKVSSSGSFLAICGAMRRQPEERGTC